MTPRRGSGSQEQGVVAPGGGAQGRRAVPVPAQGEAAGQMLVRREKVTLRNGKEFEAIVWIIDDDKDGSALRGGDKINDCYVADYKGDGVVDRMVDWIDNDSDGVPDEMDIRYFTDGRLNNCWFGMDFDDDGKMWSLAGYEYGGPSFFEADPYGNNMIYMNKFNPKRRPLGADLGVPVRLLRHRRRRAERGGRPVQRRAAGIRRGQVPRLREHGLRPAVERRAGADGRGEHPLQLRHRQPEQRARRRCTTISASTWSTRCPTSSPGCITTTRCAARRRRPWWCRTTASGRSATPTRPARPASPGTRTTTTRSRSATAPTQGRRFPMGGRVLDLGAAVHGEHRRAVPEVERPPRVERQAGRPPRAVLQRHRRADPSVRGRGRLDPDGPFRRAGRDRRNPHVRHRRQRLLRSLGGLAQGRQPVPWRVTTVRDEKARRVPFDIAWLRQFYTKEVLPEAMAANEKLMAAMSRVRPFTVFGGVAGGNARRAGQLPAVRQDIAAELAVPGPAPQLSARRRTASLSEAKMDDLHGTTPAQRASTVNSQTAWALTRSLERLRRGLG